MSPLAVWRCCRGDQPANFVCYLCSTLRSVPALRVCVCVCEGCCRQKLIYHAQMVRRFPHVPSPVYTRYPTSASTFCIILIAHGLGRSLRCSRQTRRSVFVAPLSAFCAHVCRLLLLVCFVIILVCLFTFGVQRGHKYK